MKVFQFGGGKEYKTKNIYDIQTMKNDRDIDFLYEMGCMRHLQRTWKHFLNGDFQNVAEHTLRVMWIALVLAKKEEVKDLGKVMRMALVHDIPESRTGDVNYLTRMYTTRNEEKALQEMLKDTSLEEFEEVWKEYEKRECIEAKIVKDADNLDVNFELREQQFKGNTLKDQWDELRKRVYATLYTQSAKEMWIKIQSSNPHDWHTKGMNRFHAGDWEKKTEKKKG